MKQEFRFDLSNEQGSEPKNTLMRNLIANNLSRLSRWSALLLLIWILLLSLNGLWSAAGDWSGPLLWPLIRALVLIVLPLMIRTHTETWPVTVLRVLQGLLALATVAFGLIPYLIQASPIVIGAMPFYLLAMTGVLGLCILPLLDALIVIALPLLTLALLRLDQLATLSGDLLIAVAASLLILMIARSHAHMRLKLYHSETVAAARQNQLEELAQRDPKTGLYNESAIRTRLAAELARAIRYRHPLCLLIFELDDFGTLRRKIGPSACDRLISGLAGLLNETLRTTDILGFCGDDQFLIVLPDTALENAQIAANRIQRAITGFNANQTQPVSISLGISEHHGETMESLILITEARMHQAHKLGHNQIVAD